MDNIHNNFVISMSSDIKQASALKHHMKFMTKFVFERRVIYIYLTSVRNDHQNEIKGLLQHIDYKMLLHFLVYQ